MGTIMAENSCETNRLLQCAADGDRDSWGALLTRHDAKLRRMVAFRLDQRLQGRIDPRDVIQEAYLEASEHRADYLRQPAMPFYLWLRGIVGNKLRELHRHHLGTQMRDAGREVSLYRGTTPEASSAALAAQLLGHATRPSEAAVRAARGPLSFWTTWRRRSRTASKAGLAARGGRGRCSRLNP